jgi:lipid A 4'-phosphatase
VLVDRHDTLSGSARGRRRPSRPQAIWLVAVALVSVVLFASGTLDIAVARCFFATDPADHWPLARQLPWSLLYRSATWITVALVIAGVAALVASFTPARRHWRDAGVLVLLGVALGPGLLDNFIFKDHWQHPRPREIVEFGGTMHYVPAPLIGSEGGSSFPCGHCSVGFMFGAGWWIFRRRQPRLAVASLAGGVLLGSLLGIGRMAAGAHFLSDVVWAALLAYGVLYLVDCYLPAALPEAAALHEPGPPRVAPTEPGRAESRWPAAPALAVLAALAGGVGVLMALVALPHGLPLRERLPLTAGTPRVLEVEADTASIDIVLVDAPDPELLIDGELHGFGWPGSHLEARLETQRAPVPALRYRIESRGWLTDVDGFARLTVPAHAFDRVSVEVRRGNIRVTDDTRARVVGSGLLQLQLHTGHGQVQRP